MDLVFLPIYFHLFSQIVKKVLLCRFMSGERFVISLSVKKIGGRRELYVWVMAVFTGYNFYIMKNFSLIVVGILFIYCVSSCRKQG